MASILLKPGREKSLLRRHPWIFSGAVDRLEGDPASGGTVEVLSAAGQFLARAAWSPQSQIRARVWTFDPDETVDADLLRRRLAGAIQRRAAPAFTGSDALRLVHAESDGIPGLIVDRYAGVLVASFLTAGAEAWRETLTDLLLELGGADSIFERSDADVRALEALPPRVGPLRGAAPPDPLLIHENGLTYRVDVAGGHKTGFYLDQRLNRLKVRSLADGREALDCFCYTGGFTLNLLAGGARRVLSLDASAQALEACRTHVGLNSLPADRHAVLEGDAFSLLRRFRDEGQSFDLVVLDPPKFAPTAAQVERAARGYKDINLLAFKLLRPGGVLVTFSCSGGVDAPLFQKIVASAALDAGVQAQIVESCAQSPDHPVALNFPEGAYLKGLVCLRV